MVKAVADVYRSLPAHDRDQAGIMTNFYGIAGAIDLLGKPYGLPGAICGHNNYYRWGPGSGRGEVMIVVTFNGDAWAQMFFSQVTLGATVPNMLPVRAHSYNIFVCRSPIAPLGALWHSTLSY